MSEAKVTRQSRADGTGRAGTGLRVINIVGTTRSGSTLVELLLGQLPGFVDVGELRYLWFRRLAKDGNMLCGCGVLLRECPFWEAVGGEAFGGWEQLDRDEVLRLAAGVERERYLPLLVQPRAWPAYERRLRAYTALLERLFRAIEIVSGARVVLDASKLLSHAYVLRHVESLDTRFLHIVRDPRGVAFSWGKRVRRPETVDGVSYMPRFRPTAVAARWLYDNTGAHLLGALGDPRAFMRYETFVETPHRELARVLAALGEREAVTELSVALKEAELQPTHSVCGNPLRFRTGTVPIELDDEWRREMPQRDARAVTFLAWPLLKAYGYTDREGATPAS
jgi:Sulfotransferase family